MHLEEPSFCPVDNCFFLREYGGNGRFFLVQMASGSPFGFILEKYLRTYSLFQKIDLEEQEKIKLVGNQSMSDLTASSLRFTGEVVGSSIKLVGTGIAKGIELGGKLFESVTEKGNSGNVSDSTRKGLEYGAQAAKVIADGTGVVVGAIGHGARFVGEKVGEQIRKTDSYREWKDKQTENIDPATMTIAKGAIAGLSATWSGLKDGVRAIAGGIESTTVNVVEHKYGEQYGDATRNGFEIAGNVSTGAKHLFEWSHIWLYAGIEMTAQAMSSPSAKDVLSGGIWREGFLSIYDEKLGWRTKYSRLKSRALIFYNGPEPEHEPTGILPLVAVRHVSIWKEATDKKPGTMRFFTHKIKEWVVSPDCSDDFLKRQQPIDPLHEALLWRNAMNSLLSVQQTI
eukprot:TRINITY_DN5142_c0_g1_i1.p1 TRINITY_DN5142_c0_g1~~TRINITY_DN5142_c0_g1_i1.p1  ORF type:complete len:398 (-),score=83.32 TRINITY_DN5142_c0_g1_i1:65-1258(-)